MAQFSKLVITKAGQALIAKIMAGEASDVDFTKVAASKATFTVDELEMLSALPDVMQEVEISYKARTNDVAVTIETAFSNHKLTVGYNMNTIGLFAVDPDDGEILYAACVELSGYCYMPSFNGITVSGALVKLITTVGNADKISLEVNPAVTATICDIQRLDAKKQNTLTGQPGQLVGFNAEGNAVPQDAPTTDDILLPDGTTLSTSLSQKVDNFMADPVAYEVQGGDLQTIIDALPKYLNCDIIVNCTWNIVGTITVEDFFGPGSLTLRKIDLTRKMICSNCKCKISIRQATIREPVFPEGETKRMIEIGNCTGMEIMGTSIIGTSTQCTGIVVACLDFLLYDTSIIGCATALFVDYRSIVTVKAIGDTVSYENNNIGIYVYGGGIVILANDTPDLLGGTSNARNGGGVIFNSKGTLI